MNEGSRMIVAACDGSEASLNAVRAAGELAGATGCPLKLLSVVCMDA